MGPFHCAVPLETGLLPAVCTCDTHMANTGTRSMCICFCLSLFFRTQFSAQLSSSPRLSFSPGRESDPGSHSGLSSALPTTDGMPGMMRYTSIARSNTIVVFAVGSRKRASNNNISCFQTRSGNYIQHKTCHYNKSEYLQQHLARCCWVLTSWHIYGRNSSSILAAV